MYYQVNPDSIIFLPTDSMCGSTTIAYDWTSDDMFLIKPYEYKVLKFISDNQSVSGEEVMANLTDEGEELALQTMLDVFTQKKILNSYEQ